MDMLGTQPAVEESTETRIRNEKQNLSLKEWKTMDYIGIPMKWQAAGWGRRS